MVNNRKQHTPRKPANQGVRGVNPEPNKINASTPYDFRGKNLTPYGGLLPVATMLEKLGFQSLLEETVTVKRVTKVDQLTPGSGYANISFDHHAVTHQQIAQAILSAGEFQVSFRIVIPDYAVRAEKVDAIFAKVKNEVQIEATDKEQGQFTLRFLPLPAGKAGPHGIGFNFGKIGHPLSDPAPKGLGLKVMSIFKGAPQSRTLRKPAAKNAAGQ